MMIEHICGFGSETEFGFGVVDLLRGAGGYFHVAVFG